jgi:hypothetical protein
MLLRKENNELELLKLQVQELSQELAALKLEVNSKQQNDLIGYDSGKSFARVLGNAMVKQESASEAFSNKQMFNQLVKAVSYAIGPQGNKFGSFSHD